MSGDDNRITDWALAELERLAALGAAADAGLLELPLRIHLRWYGLSGEDEDLPPLEHLFCAGGAAREALLRMWGEEGSAESMSLALRFAASPAMHDSGRTALKHAAVLWDRRYVAKRGESWLAADKAAAKMAMGETLTKADIKPLKPTTCPAAGATPPPAPAAA